MTDNSESTPAAQGEFTPEAITAVHDVLEELVSTEEGDAEYVLKGLKARGYTLYKDRP